MKYNDLSELLREAQANDRYFSRRKDTTGHRKYRRCRAQGFTPGAFGKRSKPMRVAEPMNDPRFMSRSQREGVALRAALAKRVS